MRQANHNALKEARKESQSDEIRNFREKDLHRNKCIEILREIEKIRIEVMSRISDPFNLNRRREDLILDL